LLPPLTQQLLHRGHRSALLLLLILLLLLLLLTLVLAALGALVGCRSLPELVGDVHLGQALLQFDHPL